MMDYADFYDIAEYRNANWKGNYTQKEIACNAYDYYADFLWAKENEVFCITIRELCKLLAEDGGEECKNWLYQIANELGLIDMDCHDYLETDSWLADFM